MPDQPEQTPEEAQAAAAQLAEAKKLEREEKKARKAKEEKEFSGHVPTLKEVLAAGYGQEAAERIVAEEQAKADAQAAAKKTVKPGPGQHFGYKDLTGRPYHERRGDIYWHPFETKDPMFDEDAKRIPGWVWEALVKEGKVQGVIMPNSRGAGAAFGVKGLAPKPTAQNTKPPKPAKPVKTEKNEEEEEGEEGDSNPAKSDQKPQTQNVPEGFKFEDLTEEQRGIIADPSFAGLPYEQQKSILDATTPAPKAPEAAQEKKPAADLDAEF